MLVDLCQSSYEHVPYEHFEDKRFLKKHDTNDIVCTECVQQWLEDMSIILAREMIRKAMPIMENRKKLFENKGFDHLVFEEDDPEEEENPSEDSQEEDPTSEPEVENLEGEDLVEEEEVDESEEPSEETEEETPETPSKEPGYEIPEPPEEDEDLYPWTPTHTKFTDEELKYAPEDFVANELITNFKVKLPDYLKYVLCSEADVRFIMRSSDPVIVSAINFYGPCEKCRTHARTIPNCGCSESNDSKWTPVSELIAPKEPLHRIRIELHPQDMVVDTRLAQRIYAFMSTLVKCNFDPIPKEIVQALMDESTHDKFESSYCPSFDTCCKCGKSSQHEDYYFYDADNGTYCLKCMYNIVLKRAIEANLAEEVGIANDSDTYSVEYLYRHTRGWMKAVIGRYINAMKAAGANPGIHHCMRQI